MGQKSHDKDAMPLCMQCHRDFHGATGRFKGWTKERRAGWQEQMSQRYSYVAPDVF